MICGSYNVGTGVWTDGATFSLTAGTNAINVVGTLPYADNNDLGLPVGNRFCIKFVNSEITSKSQLPSGDIVTTIGKYDTNKGTKSDFEDDGSLIVYGNAYADTNTVIKIEWKPGVISTYTFNFSNATFAPSED